MGTSWIQQRINFGTDFVSIKENDTTMTREQVDKLIRSLACSQGFYGRLVAGHYGDYDFILDAIMSNDPKDDLDVILMLEG